MNEISPVISIIVPVYNAEHWIRKCIDSVRRQTFTDFELILVNDGSTDNSGKICDEYALWDSRIVVFHKENEGLSKTRNLGMYIAKGKYVTFIDPDDWIESEHLQYFVNGISAGVDWVVEGLLEDVGDQTINIKKLEEQVYRGHDETIQGILKIKEHSNGMFASTCNKLYRRKLIENNSLFFLSDYYFREDELFNIQYCKQIKSLATLSTATYHYVNNGVATLSRRHIPSLQIYNMHRMLYKESSSMKGSEEFHSFEKQFYVENLFRAVKNLYKLEHWESRELRFEILTTFFQKKELFNKSVKYGSSLDRIFYQFAFWRLNVKWADFWLIVRMLIGSIHKKLK